LKAVSSGTYFILYSAIFALILGYYIGVIFDKSQDSIPKSNQQIQVNTFLLSKIVLVTSFIMLIGALLIALEVGSNLGGIGIYFSRPLMVRQFIVGVQNGYNEISVIYKVGGYLSNIGLMSTILGGILFSCSSKIRLIGLIPFPVLLISQLTIMGRYKFVSGLVFFFVAFILFSYFLNKESRKVRLFEILFYGLVSLTGVFTLSYWVLKLRSPLADDIINLLLESGYLYLSAGITAFDRFLSSDFIFLYGESSFRSIFKWLARFGLWPTDNVLSVNNEFVKVSANFSTNTYTFVRSLYQDFGIAGLLLVSFIWGVLTKQVIFSTYRKFNLVKLLISAIFVFSLLISFFSFYFQGLSAIVFWVLVMSTIHFLYGKKLFTYQN
jgi:oligosaccharide repeat unit polymerase